MDNVNILKLLSQYAFQQNDIEKMRGREQGSLIGTIVSTDDPEYLGRVQVQLDQKGDSLATDWAFVQGFVKGRVPPSFIGSRVVLNAIYGDGEKLIVSGFIQSTEGGIVAGPIKLPENVQEYPCYRENAGLIMSHNLNDARSTNWLASSTLKVCKLSGGEYLWVPANKSEVLYPVDPRYSQDEFAADTEYSNIQSRDENLTTLILPACNQVHVGWKFTMGLLGWEVGTEGGDEPSYEATCLRTHDGTFRWRMAHAPVIEESRSLTDVNESSFNWEPSCDSSIEGEFRTIRSTDNGSYMMLCSQTPSGGFEWRLANAPLIDGIGGSLHNVAPECSEDMRGETRLIKGSDEDYLIVCKKTSGSLTWTRMGEFYHRHPQGLDFAGDRERDVEFPYTECAGDPCF